MRITREQIDTIVETTKTIAGQDARVWLYGSRTDDARRGGDIDLLIEFETASGPLDRARIKTRLEQSLTMPKLYEYFGLIVMFYSNEHEPVHVHGK